MPVPMPKKTRQNLINATTESIYNSRVIAGSRISPFTVDMDEIQGAIRTGSSLDQSLSTYLGERHITTFIRSELHTLEIAPSEPNKRYQYFREGFPRALAESISTQLIATLESLPWTYDFTIELPGFGASALAHASGVRQLSPSIRLITGNKLNRDGHQGPPRNALIDSLSTARWIDAATYAQITIKGYVASDLQSETMLEAHEKIFSLLGLFISFDILETDYLWLNGNAGSHPITVSLHRANEIDHLVDAELDGTYQSLANDLGYTTRFIESLESEDEVRSDFDKVHNALTNAPDHRLGNAARWFFDSHAGSNDQVKFVQVMIAFEILLGDEKMAKETGLSTLMANRCAYMIGATTEQRKNIIDAFKEGYAIRSRIVHAGINRLTHTEKMKFAYMQKLCALIIRHEAEALRPNPNES